ncbi:MAG TPA: galactose oxidase early set domain-containing protein [Thermoanaerobaculia bacterium]|nr:galactose oxidase early set domain-containing protein [Thermoanaerobaculia bacterium]
MRFVRPLFTLVLLAAGLFTAPARAQSWQGPWDWKAQFIGSDCPGSSEFSHAAVIPTGPHAGKVLMWRAEFDGSCNLTGNTESWLFDPNYPMQLVRIVDGSPLKTSIFCSGASWQGNGELLVLGGASGPSLATWTYRFRPQHLGVPIDTPSGPTIYTRSSTPAWLRIGDSKIPHYYVTVISLRDQEAYYSGPTPAEYCNWIPGGSQISLGGPEDYDNNGNEFWEPIHQSSQEWGCPVVPVGMAPPNPHAGYLALIDPYYDRYSLHPPSNPADPRMDSYPRAVQLSTGEILVGGDVDTTAPCDAQWNLGPPIPLGAWWVVKPRYDTTLQPDWQLHRGGTFAQIDQFYDSMVLMHLLGSPDRVIRVGGSTPNAAHAVGSWVANDSIQEFVKGPGNSVEDGSWHTVVTDAEKLKRVFQHLVALPTGELLIVGGDKVDSYHGHGAGCGIFADSQPALRPVIYTPHPSNPSFAGTLSPLLPAGKPDPDPTVNKSIPRLYHSLAMLLPDGSVFVAGGVEVSQSGGLWPSNYRFPIFSGEVFQPAYLSLPFRPSIQTPLGEVVFGSSFQIDVLRQEANTIDRVVLMRPAALTHHFCNDQRYVELDFQHGPSDPSGGLVQETLTVNAPSHTLIQPGYSMLFVVERNASGDRSPSIGKFVKLRSTP